MAAEHSNASLPHVSERRPAVWPWLLMPLAALTLYLALHSVRMTAAQSRSQTTQSAPDGDTDP